MGAFNLYVIVSQAVALLLACLFYFGITPHRIQSLILKFVRFIRFHPQMIVMLLIIVIVNLGIITFKSVGLIRTLGVVSSCLAILILASAFGKYSIKSVASSHTQLLAIIGSHGISELHKQAKIVTHPYGPWLQWMQTALDTYGISFVPILVPASELVIALEKGVVDAVLVRDHPSAPLEESIASGKVRLLPWGEEAIEAVTKAFPTATRPAVLPANTYLGQPEKIQGYAPY